MFCNLGYNLLLIVDRLEIREIMFQIEKRKQLEYLWFSKYQKFGLKKVQYTWVDKKYKISTGIIISQTIIKLIK